MPLGKLWPSLPLPLPLLVQVLVLPLLVWVLPLLVLPPVLPVRVLVLLGGRVGSGPPSTTPLG